MAYFRLGLGRIQMDIERNHSGRVSFAWLTQLTPLAGEPAPSAQECLSIQDYITSAVILLSRMEGLGAIKVIGSTLQRYPNHEGDDEDLDGDDNGAGRAG